MDRQLFIQDLYQTITKGRSLQFKNQIKADQEIDFNQDKNISPWGSQQFRKTFQPGRYYKTIQQSYPINYNKDSIGQVKDKTRDLWSNLCFQTKNKNFFHKNKSSKQSTVNKVQVQESKRTMKLMKMNVNLDQDLLYSPQKKYGLTNEIGQKNKSKQQPQVRMIRKQQPMRMKIFKKILQKNNRLEQDKDMRKKSFLEGHLSFSHQPFSQKQSASNHPVLPKRSLKIHERQKQIQNIEEYQRISLPKVDIQRLTCSLYCKGETKSRCDYPQKLKYRKWRQISKNSLDQKYISII